MKILLLTASFPPPSSGGSVEYLYNIFSHLPPNTVLVHTGNAEAGLAKDFDQGFPQRVIRSRFVIQVVNGYAASKTQRFFEYLLWPLFALFLIGKERPDVVHLGEVNIAGLAVWFANRFFGIPYLVYTYAEEITGFRTRRFHNALMLRILRSAKAVVTVSDYTRDLLVELGVSSQCIVKILPSVRSDKYAPVTQMELDVVRKKYHLGGGPILLTVGRLVERKGHATVIEALPLLAQEFPGIRYVVVGSGPEHNKIMQIVKSAHLDDRVIFAGRVDDAELACLYEICDVFVMPHRLIQETMDTEGCPTVFLEASSHGKPLVGGDAGGVADAILDQRTGFIIDGTDVNKVIGAITQLLEDPQLVLAFGQAGRDYVSTLTPESNAQAVWALSQEIVLNQGNTHFER